MEESKSVKRLRELRPAHDIVDVSQWSKAKWLAYRQTGIGASEVGSILGLNKWSHGSVVFNQKLGIIPASITDNSPMFMGRVMEDPIVKLWEHYNPQDELEIWESVRNNMDKGNKVRRALKPEVYVRSPDIPFLFGGPDGLFKHDDDLAVLEIKTISGYSVDQYKAGIPPSYIMQIMTYMMVFESMYSEIFLLVDGNKLNCMPFEKNQNLCEIIYENTYSFWDNLQKAKEALVTGGDYLEFEPEPGDSEAYESYLKDRFKANNNLTVEADNSTMGYVKGLLKARELKKSAEKEILAYSNKLKFHMGSNTEITNLDAGYKVSWRKNDQDRRRFSASYREPK